ncbi:formate/nitrite transporter [Schinkia azotoformans MEV2011]|uniref:Formate/nitrite transporter n=1 Tax=Schinkia azotoformans MEV2011 TaxID=1348973 RepID=A0A072NEQ7_SCHAZ|nr:formate/nitrite transporter family protein [Schinkia azotoformans]KEF36154.1 formate/nitrite transporter [Schinkia azotoformans MEV2011]MEC1696254.1 formate/nitrite transporter family protein [Schinkia azotoformans]MEC1716303.1 formate/nitrite transporter family protein [Schinkia azotoformans]MEC1727112.1 formate/nitrite transporter family protein [Schinkia azotoformans]MEC1741680.1 formate/nitrite transporter family protein [Schinkia azotoformans]
MAFNPPEKILKTAIVAGVKKVNLPLSSTLILGFLAGVYISFGFLLHIRITAGLPIHWGSMPDFIGAALFPLGLILVLVAGGELLTGNFMAVTTARLSGKITTWHIAKNWSVITISNFIGSVFVAYLFGHHLGLTETEPFITKTIAVAESKLNESFQMALISGIGANWLVCLAVWLAYAAKDTAGKIIGIWFPIMAFVTIGFQHVIANMFIIPAAIFAGAFNWFMYLENFIAVFLGNAIGGALFVGSFYWMAYSKNL